MQTRKLNRRDFLRLSAAAATVAVAAGCAPATSTPVEEEVAVEPEATAKPVEAAAEPAEEVMVTIFVGMGTGTDAAQQQVQDALADEWNSTHDGTKMEYLYVPHDESRTKWAAMLAAGTPPAINMPSGVEQVGRYRDTNLDIGPYIERDDYDLSDFPELIPEVSKYEDVLYGIPVGVYPSVLYYNENIFDEAGVDYPPHEWETSGWTYDVLVEMAMKVSIDSNGKNASEADFAPADQVQWGYDEVDCGLALNGAAQSWGAENMGWSDDFRTLYFNQKAFVDHLQWISDAVWKSNIMASAEQVAGASPGFNTGKLAINNCHSWMLGGMVELPFLWNVAAKPAGPTGIVKAQCDVDAFLICNRFADLDAAWEVVKWLMEPDQMLQLDLTFGALPPRISLQDAYIDTMTEIYPRMDLKVFFDSLNYIDVPNHESFIPRYGEVWDTVWAGYDPIMTGTEKDAQIVLDGVQEIIQGFVDEYWDQQS